MKWAWKQRLPPTEKLALLTLADATDEHGSCRPSIAVLAARCGIDTHRPTPGAEIDGEKSDRTSSTVSKRRIEHVELLSPTARGQLSDFAPR